MWIFLQGTYWTIFGEALLTQLWSDMVWFWELPFQRVHVETQQPTRFLYTAAQFCEGRILWRVIHKRSALGSRYLIHLYENTIETIILYHLKVLVIKSNWGILIHRFLFADSHLYIKGKEALMAFRKYCR